MDPRAVHRREVGDRGEDLAAQHLRRVGMRVLARNRWNREGEVDLLARDGPVLVVAEVKTRTSLVRGHPSRAVTEEKRRRLFRLARHWARHYGVPTSRTRVDTVSVLMVGGRVFVSHERGTRR
ncbi:YraN family protein [Nocardiopsis salina]|uniref:YraN family protein n=1 Tax=Nocardiopsis salina TaxID=245836 RepID=UPI00034AA236|nr:YraN family protein [Nocardiopsis salina]